MADSGRELRLTSQELYHALRATQPFPMHHTEVYAWVRRAFKWIKDQNDYLAGRV